MSSETLDEARRAVMAFPWAQDTSAQHEALNRFEVLVRADAERVQRERAEKAEAGFRAASQNADTWFAATERQRERADGLRQTLDELCHSQKAAIDSATRPYRMAIARWWIAVQPLGLISKSDAYKALRSLLTDADLDAARKENPDVR